MAVMGVQVVVTLLAASLMQKLAPHCSFARWLLCNGSLRRYRHPSDEELCALAGKQRPKSKRDRRANGVADDKPLSVPRDIDLHLDTSPITAVDALVLRYFLDYQWFVDFAVYATAVYIFTEGYYCLVDPQKEMNIGVLWCLLTVAFSIKVFFMVMRHYFRSEEGGERSVCLTFAFFFLLLAMVALVIREDYLDFGLEPGLASVSSNLESVLKPRGWEWTLPLAKLAFKMGLVALCSFLGACLTFPGLRLAQMHRDALRMAADSPLTQGPAPREFPGTCPRGGDVDQAHLAGFHAARTHGQADGADHVRLCLQHRAPLDHRWALRLALGHHPPPPAGVPGPGRALGAADEEGSRTHPRPGDPAPDHQDLLLRLGGQPAVPGTHRPHPALHAAPQDAGAPLVGAVPGAPSPPCGSARGTATAQRGGRGGRTRCGGANHRHPGRHLHPPLLPWTFCLPHLVGGRLPACHQPLRLLLPPVPGGLLTAGSWDLPRGAVGAPLVSPLLVLVALADTHRDISAPALSEMEFVHPGWRGHPLLLPPVTTVPALTLLPLRALAPLPSPTGDGGAEAVIAAACSAPSWVSEAALLGAAAPASLGGDVLGRGCCRDHLPMEETSQPGWSDRLWALLCLVFASPS